ncbi:MAG TPA: hypothetical protein P5084_03115 [Paludibacter sp.]|nr:hypothetical protein [Paludibacter sp.]
MKALLIIVLGFFPVLIFAQLKPAYYVTNSYDTVKCQIVALKDFWGKKTDPAAFHGRITVEENGVKKKFKPHEIKSFTVFDSDKLTFKYVSLPEDKKYFVRMVVEGGDLTLYNFYSFHPYDKSYSPISVFVKEGKQYRVIPIKYKKTIESMISDKPEIYAKWKGGEYKNSTFEKITLDYNAAK